MTILLNMSLSGSVVVFIWLILYPLCKQKFSQKWHMNILKIGLLFFLAPVSILIPNLNFMQKVTRPIVHIVGDMKVIHQANSMINTASQNSVSQNAILMQNNIPSVGIVQLLVVLWGIGIVIILIYKLFIYCKLNQLVLCNSVDCTDDNIISTFLFYKKKMCIRGKVFLKVNVLITTPLVIGLLRPKIILPHFEMTDEELKYIFMHELNHIKYHDLWFRLLAFVAFVLHWFNPFAHIMNRQIKNISELCCDEMVVTAMSRTERRDYGRVILKMMSVDSVEPKEFCTPLSARQNIERRLSFMLNFKKRGNMNKLLSTILAILIISMGTINVFAFNSSNSKITNNIVTSRQSEFSGIPSPSPIDKNENTETSDNSSKNTTFTENTEMSDSPSKDTTFAENTETSGGSLKDITFTAEQLASIIPNSVTNSINIDQLSDSETPTSSVTPQSGVLSEEETWYAPGWNDNGKLTYAPVIIFYDNGNRWEHPEFLGHIYDTSRAAAINNDDSIAWIPTFEEAFATLNYNNVPTSVKPLVIESRYKLLTYPDWYKNYVNAVIASGVDLDGSIAPKKDVDISNWDLAQINQWAKNYGLPEVKR